MQILRCVDVTCGQGLRRGIEYTLNMQKRSDCQIRKGDGLIFALLDARCKVLFDRYGSSCRCDSSGAIHGKSMGIIIVIQAGDNAAVLLMCDGHTTR